MKKCLIVGKFAQKHNIMDGQTVKCKTIYDALTDKYGENNVTLVDTYNWKKNPIKVFFRCFKGFRNHENIIMLPAQKGVKIFAPLFTKLQKIYKRKIYYVVIGSWLYKKIQNDNGLKKSLIKFNGIFVETNKLKNDLESANFKNVVLMRNYKNITPIDSQSIKLFDKKNETLKVCIFSRVNREKGIIDAINVVKNLNEKKCKIQLDIYGMVEKQFEMEFNKYLNENSDYVYYKGIIDSSKSVDIIKKYDLLLFPTKYLTEGIPGTIIDSYAAGVPVLVSSWENCYDIIDKNTGIIYKFGDINDFQEKLKYVYYNREKIYKMKRKCLEKSIDYCSIEVLDPLFLSLDGDSL